jgi:hypothetical protein
MMRKKRRAVTPKGRQPIQELYFDERKTIRFRENVLVRHLLDEAPPVESAT